MKEKRYEICIGNTYNLCDVIHATSWQKCKSIMKKDGAKGGFILVEKEKSYSDSFKIININIE
ncbi:MAG: hypothetical protein RR406_04790 [Bacilli bacterium]